jgi:hypothetical protein
MLKELYYIIFIYKILLPPLVSPLVTNGGVFSGYIAIMEKPRTSSQFVQPRTTHQTRSGLILALGEHAGQEPRKFNVAGPTMVGGPSVGDPMLFSVLVKLKGIMELEDRWLCLNYQRNRASTLNDNDYQHQTLHPVTVLFSPKFEVQIDINLISLTRFQCATGTDMYEKTIHVL